MINSRDIRIEGKHQKPILADVFYNDDKSKKPIVIFCHGYKGFKDWGAWNLVAEAFANAGMFFIKFNFSHNGGNAEQPVDFPDLEAFGNNNYIKELDDLEIIINWVTSSGFEFKNQIDTSSISLIGHSRGGGIAILKAAEDSRITKLITWASVSDYKKRFPKGESLEIWKNNGVMYIGNGRTKQQMPHYFQFYTSFIDNEKRLTIATAVKKNQIPYLIIHGTEDPTVDVQEGKQIYAWSTKGELFLIKGADHVFGVKHPWNKEQLPKHLSEILQKTIDFVSL
ncbi:alpha/beta hydrolase family protein [Aquimarina sediminis]|uniref:alpha/beta hydrolase family protein n=1 Tax=Aquimarina sediminis TaxID=2070536 RepID=UPI000CA05240|nr:acetylxylan esterase [Aquimarina sediminis]